MNQLLLVYHKIVISQAKIYSFLLKTKKQKNCNLQFFIQTIYQFLLLKELLLLLHRHKLLCLLDSFQTLL